jgi:hypothetical protein
MALYQPKVLSIFGALFICFLTACYDYTHELAVEDAPGLLVGKLTFPKESFDYYKKDSLRYNAYVFYFNDRSFFDLNRSKIAVTLKDKIIEPGTSWDLRIHFEESSYSPPFDYSLVYDYMQLHTGDPLVEADGLLNEENDVYMLRIMNFKSEAKD